MTAGREVFATNEGCRDRATRKLFDVGIRESFLTNAYRLSPIKNLALFWRETYPKLKRELQRKYSKHEWC